VRVERAVHEQPGIDRCERSTDDRDEIGIE
jgi:hypothetical protein